MCCRGPAHQPTRPRARAARKRPADSDPALFERILCGIDGTPESAEVARQVAQLAPPEAEIVLVGVTQPVAAAPPGLAALAAPLLEAKRKLEVTLERTRAELAESHAAQILLLEGTPIPTLLDAIARERATLVAVGIHRRSMALGAALGSVATAMLQHAPASVYVGRGRAREPLRSIVVGVDGSAVSRAALDAAVELAARTGSDLRALVALGGKGVDAEAAREAAGVVPLAEIERGPVEALVEAGADLIVVGSRGLHGLRALGSVSERVAHRARSPVLVVRWAGAR